MKRRKRVWNRLVVFLVMASMVMSMCMTAFAEEEVQPDTDTAKTEADVQTDDQENSPEQEHDQPAADVQTDDQEDGSEQESDQPAADVQTDDQENSPEQEPDQAAPACTGTEDCEAAEHEEGCPKSAAQNPDMTDTEDAEDPENSENEVPEESADEILESEEEVALLNAEPIPEEPELEMAGRVRIGSTGYDTLKAALDAAEAGDKVILQEDVEIDGSDGRMFFEDKDLTLDLCGHEIRLTDSKYYAMYFSNSRIEIKDSSDEQSGRIVNEAGGYSLIYVWNNSTFSMTGGTLQNSTEGRYALAVQNHSSVNISGAACIVNTAANGLAFEVASSKAEVAGESRIENTGAGGKAVNLVMSSEFILSENGAIIQEDAAGAAGIVADRALANAMAQIRITGGTLRSKGAGINVGGASAEVAGGTIEAGSSIFVDTTGQAGLNGMKKIHISGGTFTAPVFAVQGEDNAKCAISIIRLSAKGTDGVMKPFICFSLSILFSF